MSVAAYIRVSDDKCTYENQRKQIADYCKNAGYTDVVWFEDIEHGDIPERDGFNALLAAVSRKDVAKVLFVAIDRITRAGAKHAHDFFYLLRNLDVGYKSITDTGIDSDLKTPFIEDILITVMSSFASQELQKIRSRTVAALALRKAQGMKLGGRVPTIGKRGHVGDRQRIAELMQLPGMSQRKIAKQLRLSKGVVQRCMESLRAS